MSAVVLVYETSGMRTQPLEMMYYVNRIDMITVALVLVCRAINAQIALISTLR